MKRQVVFTENEWRLFQKELADELNTEISGGHRIIEKISETEINSDGRSGDWWMGVIAQSVANVTKSRN